MPVEQAPQPDTKLSEMGPPCNRSHRAHRQMGRLRAP
jgi:hypothetical protein